MPYIGNPIYQSAFVTDQFSGTGSQTAYTMSVAPAGTTNVLVVVSGVVQDPSTYGVVGNTLTFSAAPPSGTGNISCRYLGVPVTGVTTTAYRTVTEFTATAGQTTFTPPSYNVGFINVYLNGVLLGSADYTATNGTTVVLTTGASAGNILTVESFNISSVANAIANAAGAVSASNLATDSVTTTKIADANVTDAKIVTVSASKLTGSQTIPKATLPTGSVLQVVQSTSSTVFSTTSQTLVDSGISASITPLFATSKILVQVSSSLVIYSGGGTIALYRGATQVYQPSGNDGTGYFAQYFASAQLDAFASISYLDSPASASSVTYKIYVGTYNGNVVTINYNAASQNAKTNIILMEIAA